MLTKIKALLLTGLVGASTLFLAAPALAVEDINSTCTQWQIDQGLCTPGLRDMAKKIMNWFLLFLGLIATGFLIYGGFLYVTSAGNDDNVKKAKNIIIYAAVGILVIILAAVVVNALLDLVLDSGTPESQ
jgi:hypothetical protein